MIIKIFLIWVAFGVIVSLARLDKVKPKAKAALADPSLGALGDLLVKDILGSPWHAWKMIKKATDEDDSGPTPTGTA